MAEDERREEEREEEAPSEEQPPQEGSAPEEEPAPEEEQAPEPEQAPEAEQAPADEQAPEPEQAPEAPAEEPAAAEKGGEREAPPGAELEPIAIEAEREERELDAEERARREAEAEERARAEAEATAEAGEEEPAPRRAPTVALEGDARFRATGKRKSSVARVMLIPGSGRFEVNRRALDEYFTRSLHRKIARQPLVTTGYEQSVDVRVRVHGGGVSGQAGAVRHGVARALCEIDPELRKELKRRGLLTRDARRKERRKAGLKKARKRPQFSKR
jgi:small subunit ribosomal protein S9